MDAIKSSYQFHRELESPLSFVRREWPALTIFGGVFVIVLLIGVLAVDPAYFYPRLGTDPLLYYLKGLAFAETGHTVARTAINREPFNYVAMPGIMRAPFMMVFRDFDDQLRAIQLSNIALVTITAVMFAYVLSWVLPRSRHWMAIGFTFGFMLIQPEWVANVFQPLADAPYAAFTVAGIIVSARLLTSDGPLGGRLVAIAVAVALFVIAFMVKFTAPVMVAFVAALAAGRPRTHPVRPRTKILGSLAIVAGTALLVALNWNTIMNRYLPEPIAFLRGASKTGMLLNLMGVALPSQIIPVYNLAFIHEPISRVYRPVFGTTLPDIALTALGIGISLLILYGMWHARRRFMPEIWYLLSALPVLTLVIPSTRRYLMPYEPFVWIFFYAGAAAMLRPLLRRMRVRAISPTVGLSLLLVFALGLLFVRSQRVVGTAGDRRAGISIGRARDYVDEVVSTFGDLRKFLETLPRNRSLLVGDYGTIGRWTVISGLNYYFPDSALSVAAREHDVYVLVECGTLEICQDFETGDSRFRGRLDQLGPFSYENVFSHSTPHAKARVYRLRNLQ